MVQEARVLSLAGGVVLQIGDRIEINPPGRIAFTGLPAGLRSKPTLLARMFPGQAGPNDLRLDYLTHGLSWRADYVARLNRAGDRPEIGRGLCRERVCQYVEISVVPDSLTKQKKNS